MQLVRVNKNPTPGVLQLGHSNIWDGEVLRSCDKRELQSVGTSNISDDELLRSLDKSELQSVGSEQVQQSSAINDSSNAENSPTSSMPISTSNSFDSANGPTFNLSNLSRCPDNKPTDAGQSVNQVCNIFLLCVKVNLSNARPYLDIDCIPNVYFITRNLFILTLWLICLKNYS